MSNKTELTFSIHKAEQLLKGEADKQFDKNSIKPGGIEVRIQRNDVVLAVAGEIFGAIKRHGLLDAEDPEALDEWVHEMGLHHHLLHIAYPWTENLEGMEYAKELDGFDAELSDVINPS